MLKKRKGGRKRRNKRKKENEYSFRENFLRFSILNNSALAMKFFLCPFLSRNADSKETLALVIFLFLTWVNFALYQRRPKEFNSSRLMASGVT
jgi:hypothetical protein